MIFAKAPAASRTSAQSSVMALDPMRPAKLVPKVAGGVSCDPFIGAMAVEAESGRVLFSCRADAKGQPASVTKLMTLLLVMEAVENGRLSLKDHLTASSLAVRQSPSICGLRQGQSMTVDDLCASLMVKSANDAAVVLAEYVAAPYLPKDATPEVKLARFVKMMNERAAEIGMKNTVYTSPNGLPPAKWEKRKPDVSTAEDLVLLARTLVKREDVLRYTSMAHCTVTGGNGLPITFENHNPFVSNGRNIKKFPGCDGLKTGFTNAAGSSIALTAKRGAKRVIVVVLGSSSSDIRNLEALRLLTDAVDSISW